MKIKIKHESGHFRIGLQCAKTQKWVVTTVPLHPLVSKVIRVVKLEEGATLDLEVEGTYISEEGGG